MYDEMPNPFLLTASFGETTLGFGPRAQNQNEEEEVNALLKEMEETELYEFPEARRL